jgi:acetylornithine deacetylase/succinyl-diaminopimelate desuccinylase-like protein
VSRLSRAGLRAYAERMRPTYERWLRRLVEIPSVSSDPAHQADVSRVARLAVALVTSAGGRARLVPTGGHPLVLGEMNAGPSFPTVALYNHLDVQPAERRDGWRTDPFRLVKRDGRYFGRGTTDDKGPAIAALFGAAAARAAGVPVNVRLFWELEEEIGSPHLERALRRLGRRAAPDAVIVSDTAWLTRRRPTATAGLRGWQGFRFRLETAESDVHSGVAGGAARNPIGELMELMCTIHDPRTGRVQVPGFYDDVAPLTARERADLRRSGFRVAVFKKDNRLGRLRSERPLEVMERIWALPTFEVHGVDGGYPGPGLKSVVPARAEVKASCRLVPHQRPERVAKLISAFARRHNPDVVVEVEKGGSPPCRTETTGPLATALKRAMAFAFGREPAFVRDSGTIGAVNAMQKIWGCPVGFLDLSLPDHGYHAPNENFEWRQAARGMAAFARLLEEIAASRRAYELAAVRRSR